MGRGIYSLFCWLGTTKLVLLSQEGYKAGASGLKWLSFSSATCCWLLSRCPREPQNWAPRGSGRTITLGLGQVWKPLEYRLYTSFFPKASGGVFASGKSRGAEAATALVQAETTQHSLVLSWLQSCGYPEHHHPRGSQKAVGLSPPEGDKESFTEQVASWCLTRGSVR